MATASVFIAHRNLKPTDDYGIACTEGVLLAARYAQFLLDNPRKAGDNDIGRIVDELNAKNLGESGHGYLVGFFCELECMILRGAWTCNPMASALEHNAQMDVVLERARRESVNEVGPEWEA